MIPYLSTSLLILGVMFAFAVLWQIAAFYYQISRSIRSSSSFFVLPALVIAPMLMIAFFSSFGINLIYPLQLFAESSELLIYAIAPALVLFVASGCFSQVLSNTSTEIDYWQNKPFYSLARAQGLDRSKPLRRVVMMRSFTKSMSQCLPWALSELIIVEAIFNAPGLGLDAWHLAKQRDFAGLVVVVGLLVVIYGLCVLLNHSLNRWLGRRLTGYV